MGEASRPIRYTTLVLKGDGDCNFPLGSACEKRPPQVQVNLPETQVLKGESRTCGGPFSQANLSGKLADGENTFKGKVLEVSVLDLFGG